MNKVLVFYAGLLYGEYTVRPTALDLPDGAYVKDGVIWWHKQNGCTETIELEEVPKELLLLALLLT